MFECLKAWKFELKVNVNVKVNVKVKHCLALLDESKAIFGCVGTCSDVFRCIRMRLEVFGRFWMDLGVFVFPP